MPTDNAPYGRQHDRLRLPTGYTAVHVKRHGRALHGHAYDISMSGVRIELDQPLHFGEHVDLDLELPGAEGTTVHAQGMCVRFHDDEETGPVRMGIHFDRLTSSADFLALKHYVEMRGVSTAA